MRHEARGSSWRLVFVDGDRKWMIYHEIGQVVERIYIVSSKVAS